MPLSERKKCLPWGLPVPQSSVFNTVFSDVIHPTINSQNNNDSFFPSRVRKTGMSTGTFVRKIIVGKASRNKNKFDKIPFPKRISIPGYWYYYLVVEVVIF